MSIDKTKGLDSVQQSLLNEAAQVSLSSNKKKLSVTDLGSLLTSQDAIDTISVSGGRDVLNMLDPVKTAEDQQAKVDRIKKLVQSGQYKTPDSNTLAQSVAGELNVEDVVRSIFTV